MTGAPDKNQTLIMVLKENYNKIVWYPQSQYSSPSVGFCVGPIDTVHSSCGSASVQ